MARLEYRTISHRTVHALPIGDKDAVYWDRKLQGFGVRVYPSGSKVYVVQTRAGGKSKRVAIGRHGVITSEQARAKATQIIARIKAGEDPDPEAAKPAPVPTVAELAERYLTEHIEVRCKPRTVEACRWLVKKFVTPDLGKMAIDAVDREHIAALHHKHRDTPYQANRILEVVRKMFNLAEAWGLRKDGGNPCRFVQKYKEKKRERFLTDEEFHRLGQVLNEIEADGSETASALTSRRQSQRRLLTEDPFCLVSPTEDHLWPSQLLLSQTGRGTDGRRPSHKAQAGLFARVSPNRTISADC